MDPSPLAHAPNGATPDAALRLGPFLVDAGGRLWPAPEAAPRFLLRWRDRAVRAELQSCPPEAARGCPAGGRLSLGSLVAKVPSSAELASGELGSGELGSAEPSDDATPRETLFATLRAVTPLLPPGWRLTLAADHHIGGAADEAMEMPVSAVQLVAALSMFLLTLAPYLDLLEQHGAAVPSRALAGGTG